MVLVLTSVGVKRVTFYKLWTHFIDMIRCFQFHMITGHFNHLGKRSAMNDKHTINS